jgi:N-methylhydantoinase B/oxoprolinase/acetone carboxylase alpha subunit
MKYFPMAFLILAACMLSLNALSQDMDPQDGVYRKQYEQYRATEQQVQAQFNATREMKTQVDSLISQVGGASTTNYSQEVEKYRQLELFIPVALRYAQELEVFQRQLDEIRAKKEDIRARVLSRQSALPLWWTE